jgi:hypothetical protein
MHCQHIQRSPYGSQLPDHRAATGTPTVMQQPCAAAPIFAAMMAATRLRRHFTNDTPHPRPCTQHLIDSCCCCHKSQALTDEFYCCHGSPALTKPNLLLPQRPNGKTPTNARCTQTQVPSYHPGAFKSATWHFTKQLLPAALSCHHSQWVTSGTPDATNTKIITLTENECVPCQIFSSVLTSLTTLTYPIGSYVQLMTFTWLA